MNDNRDFFLIFLFLFFLHHIDSFSIASAQRKFIKKNGVILIDFWYLASVIHVLLEI